MYYFDNKLLAQYIDQGVKLKVYANDEWYSIVDEYDVQDPSNAVVYDSYGESSTVDYRDITQIKVGSKVYTLDMLQIHMTGKSTDGEKEKPVAKKDTEEVPDEEPGKEPPEKEPDLSWYSPVYDIGKEILKEIRRRKR